MRAHVWVSVARAALNLFFFFLQRREVEEDKLRKIRPSLEFKSGCWSRI